jgi:hypothetical protein
MPDTAWRCSECGTVNAPAANSCRTCGRWPSLFDLQDNAVGEVVADESEGDELDEAAFDVEEFEPETDGSGGASVESARPARRRRRQLVRLIVPLGIVIYLLISSYFSNH